jgi:hypothetical protein
MIRLSHPWKDKSPPSPDQSDAILKFIQQTGLNRPHPVRVLYPPIHPGERDWRDYYKVLGNNLPDEYHNGGIRPWVGGLYIAALVRQNQMAKAKEELSDWLLPIKWALNLGSSMNGCMEFLENRWVPNIKRGRPVFFCLLIIA